MITLPRLFYIRIFLQSRYIWGYLYNMELLYTEIGTTEQKHVPKICEKGALSRRFKLSLLIRSPHSKGTVIHMGDFLS